MRGQQQLLEHRAMLNRHTYVATFELVRLFDHRMNPEDVTLPFR